jgi:hypothetical protein
VVAYAFVTASVAVHNSGIGFPRVRGLVLQFLSVWIVGFDAGGNFGVYSFLDFRRYAAHNGQDLADVLNAVSALLIEFNIDLPKLYKNGEIRRNMWG